MASPNQLVIEFSSKIRLIAETQHLTAMEAIIHYCNKNNMEIEAAAELVDSELKARLRRNAEDLNLLPKTGKLPI